MNEQTKMTAMQTLIKMMYESVKQYSDNARQEAIFFAIIEEAKKLLAIEKNNIVDAHTAGNRLEVYDGTETAGENYYTTHFKPIN